MENYLYEFEARLKRLQKEGVNQRDKESLENMAYNTKKIIQFLEEEKREILRIAQHMEDNHILSREVEPVQVILSKKRRELDAWDEVRNTINMLIR